MLITFLVGNGFDISAGIDTSYRGFYNWYIKQSSSSNVIQQFKHELQGALLNNAEKWSDFEIGLGKYTADFALVTADKFVEIYEDAHESMIQYLSKR